MKKILKFLESKMIIFGARTIVVSGQAKRRHRRANR